MPPESLTAAMRAILTAAVLAAAFAASAFAQTPQSTPAMSIDRADAAVAMTENVTATLAADSLVVTPGQTFYVALSQDIREGWHTYWRNPGDSGEATEIALDMPEGWTAGDILWPAPEALPFGPLMNYGFKGEALLPVPVTVPADFEGEAALIRAQAYWLVCEEICIPESGEMSLSVRVSDGAPRAHPRWGPAIAGAIASLPRPALFDAAIAVARDGETARLTLRAPELAEAQRAGALRAAYFFPFDKGVVEPAAPQKPRALDEAVALDLTPGFELEDGAFAVGGVLAYERRGSEGWARETVEIAAEPAGALAALPAGAAGAGMTLLLALAGAFAGGLLLNLMPCVFPVLSLKALSFARTAHDSPAEVRVQGLFFLAGVVSTFAALGLALVALKGAGAAIGWGFQLQSPAVIMALILLFFAISLNLLGFFELGGGLQNLGARLTQGSGGAAAFFTGALAVVVATPCTAPFMAAALGYALTLDALGALAVFLALGLGLAAPFTLLAFAPGLLRRLPRPGPWMERFKQVMAFPMLAATVWLVWVISLQTGPEGVAFALSGVLALGFAVWAGRLTSRAGKAMAAGAALAALATVPAAARMDPPAGIRGFHRRLVHHVQGQRARDAEIPVRHRGVPRPRRGRPCGRLDQQGRTHRARAGAFRPRRGAALPALPAGRARAADPVADPDREGSSARARGRASLVGGAEQRRHLAGLKLARRAGHRRRARDIPIGVGRLVGAGRCHQHGVVAEQADARQRRAGRPVQRPRLARGVLGHAAIDAAEIGRPVMGGDRRRRERRRLGEGGEPAAQFGVVRPARFGGVDLSTKGLARFRHGAIGRVQRRVPGEGGTGEGGGERGEGGEACEHGTLLKRETGSPVARSKSGAARCGRLRAGARSATFRLRRPKPPCPTRCANIW